MFQNIFLYLFKIKIISKHYYAIQALKRAYKIDLYSFKEIYFFFYFDILLFNIHSGVLIV